MHYVAILLIIFLSSCTYSSESNSKSAKVFNISSSYSKVRPGYHTVIRGDTLSSISKRYGVSLHSLIKANRISGDSIIYPGQSLLVSNLKEERGDNKVTDLNRTLSITRSRAEPTRKVSHIVYTNGKDLNKVENRLSVSNKKLQSPRKPSVEATGGGNIKWRWPTAQGNLIRGFDSELTRGKGIHIKGVFNSPITSVADGVVVYSGNALKGYGNLIIIKHDNNYLSAYAHNHINVVKEGETVKLGQHIANMGKDYDDNVLLHFELRKNGRPVDPERYIRPK